MSLICHVEWNQDTFSNDEARMTNDEIRNGAFIAAASIVIRTPSFIRHFGIRHFSSHLLRYFDPEKAEALFQDSSSEVAQGEPRAARRFL
jgi:hypothetical protein